jgi:hypothetical protein
MAKTKDTLYTVFLEFQASFPEEAELMAGDLTPARREGRVPLYPVDVQFIDDFFVMEEQLMKEEAE